MPWDNNTGGGGRNGGGPWGSPSGSNGPRRPSGPPSLEDLLNRGRDRFRGGVPGHMPGGRWAILGVVVVVVAAWLTQCFYTISPQETGVELLFGRPSTQVSQQGLHFLFWPFQTVERVQLTLNQTDIGSSSADGSPSSNEGLMLTADQNIVDVRFSVLWAVADPQKYLFDVNDPADMVRAAGESAMREVIGRRPAADAFRAERSAVETQVQQITQGILDSYNAGVRIVGVQLRNVAPPAEVADAFDEVQRAEQDEDRFQEEARQYANTKLGQARGQAAQIREDAAAYKDRVVKQAQGEAARFTSVYQQYAKAPAVTRERLYLETMEQVFGQSNKVIVDKAASGGVVPYLPLPQLAPAAPAAPGTGNATPARGDDGDATPPPATMSAPDGHTTTGD